ncbi:OmpA family protein [Photobacterium sp. BZF1]|uniref:OmpA family protein n=1 Tax=Photobacterium sp. BZF1 TaxID=1904457 RepID=UPI001653C0A9|nr:OmpA family protein [Photobacterium sp. BZF1]MBC7001624.1 OmpA family protein [Photobacterium sp. BZF1]
MESQYTIVKKGRRRRQPLQHGGWKVAMADLMISLMCLFLVLWILQVVDIDDQKKLLNYFVYGNDPVMPMGSTEVGANSISPLPLPNVATSHYDAELHRVNDTSVLEGEFNSQQELELLAERVMQELAEVDGLGSVSVLVTPQGVRLVILDSNKGPMFINGSARVTPFYQDLLLSLAGLLQRIENKMIITGHTDASRFKNGTKTNWELSSERANQARYYLNRGGLKERHIFQVSGMSDTAPIDPDDLSAEINRRIELYILTAKSHAQLNKVFKHFSMTAGADKAYHSEQQLHTELIDIKQQATKQAEWNQPVTPFDVMTRYE